MQRVGIAYKRASGLDDVISDHRLKGLYLRFIRHLSRLHDSIKVESTSVEVRVFYLDKLICRVVPYRELFHVQIGEWPTWEIRVRDEGGYAESLDRAIEYFLSAYPSARNSSYPHGGL